MTPAEILAGVESIVRSGFAALAVTVIVAVWQTRELSQSRKREDDCARNLRAARVGIARLYGIVKARLGEHDPMPSLDELMADRRTPETH
ncbi:MAG TPA: hypothetical protein VFZ38_19445 [Vicinamibacterales bacterium]